MDGHEVPPGAPPMPVHYDLHVWLYKSNPAGELTPENPRVGPRAGSILITVAGRRRRSSLPAVIPRRRDA